jgi:hypothetical protein
VLRHVAPLRHGEDTTHSSTSSSQRWPVYPRPQVQAKSRKLLDGEHRAPWWHLSHNSKHILQWQTDIHLTHTSYITLQLSSTSLLKISCHLQWLIHDAVTQKLSSNLSLVWGSMGPICPLADLFGKHRYNFTLLTYLGNNVSTPSTLISVLEAHPDFSPVWEACAQAIQFLMCEKHASSMFSFSPVWGTGVQFVQTVSTCVWQFTHTLVCIDKVNARPPILTRVYGTIIHVCLTVCTRIARQTLARVRIQVVLANASMLTWVGPTLINVLFTLFAWKQ